MKMRNLALACILLGILAIIFMFHCQNYQKVPAEVNVTVGSDIEKMAAERNITVMQVDDIEYKFSESVGLGGAGGLGAVVSKATNKTQIIELAQHGQTVIFYDYTILPNTNRIVKRYLASESPVALIWREGYELEELCPAYPIYYSLKGESGSTVIFGKDPKGIFIGTVMWGIILGGIYLLIVKLVYPQIWKD